MTFWEMPPTTVLSTRQASMRTANFISANSWHLLWRPWLTLFLPWISILVWSDIWSSREKEMLLSISLKQLSGEILIWLMRRWSIRFSPSFSRFSLNCRTMKLFQTWSLKRSRSKSLKLCSILIQKRLLWFGAFLRGLLTNLLKVEKKGRNLLFLPPFSGCFSWLFRFITVAMKLLSLRYIRESLISAVILLIDFLFFLSWQ